jgi:ClpP class serine protease
VARRRIRYTPPKGPVAVAPKAWGEEFFFSPFAESDVTEPLFTEEGDYAVVEVQGPLSQRTTFWMDSYESIRARVADALNSGLSSVCLRIDSPGGDYAGALELSRELRQMAADAGKRLVAFTDGMALSAGYAIACAASEIVATESACVGSIGVWAPLVDVTAQDAMFGTKVVIAASGTAKADRNPHVAMTKESIARLQETVDGQAALFFDLVSEARGIDVLSIKALEGAEVFGAAALTAQLCDRIVNSWSSFLSNSESKAMKPKASKYLDEAKVALRRAAEGEDEEEKKAAEKALKALETDDDKEKKDKKEEGDEEAKAEGEADAKAKGEADEKDKKDGEEKAKALAAASNELTLAQEVQALKAAAAKDRAERAAEKDAEARSKLYASRPDLSAAQKKAFDRLPLSDAKAVIETMPRVTATPGAAAAAMTPTVSGGERREAYQPTLSAEEEALLLKTGGGKAMGPKRAVQIGTVLQMPNFTPAEAAAYVAEQEKASA